LSVCKLSCVTNLCSVTHRTCFCSCCLDDEDSFDGKLTKIINEGKDDLKDGKGIVGDLSESDDDSRKEESRGGKKRDSAERDEISFSEDDEASGIFSLLPENVRRGIGAIPTVEERVAEVNAYLNHLLFKLPILQQQIILSAGTNSEKFSKLREYYKTEFEKRPKVGGWDV
jgi:hypothetical protein